MLTLQDQSFSVAAVKANHQLVTLEAVGVAGAVAAGNHCDTDIVEVEVEAQLQVEAVGSTLESDT